MSSQDALKQHKFFGIFYVHSCIRRNVQKCMQKYLSRHPSTEIVDQGHWGQFSVPLLARPSNVGHPLFFLRSHVDHWPSHAVCCPAMAVTPPLQATVCQGSSCWSMARRGRLLRWETLQGPCTRSAVLGWNPLPICISHFFFYDTVVPHFVNALLPCCMFFLYVPAFFFIPCAEFCEFLKHPL